MNFLQKKINAGTFTAHWIAGLAVSFLMVWAVTLIFSDSQTDYEFNRTLDKHVRKPGSVVLHRSEGWGTTHIGDLGMSGGPDLSVLEPPFVAIWGDSHIEALQMDDPEKVDAVLTRLSRQDDRSPTTGLNLGSSGLSLADFCLDIPVVELAISGIASHYIVLTDIKDTRPDQPTARHARFISDPVFSIETRHDPYRNPNSVVGKRKWIKHAVHAARLDFAWAKLKTGVLKLKGIAANAKRRIRLLLSPSTSTSGPTLANAKTKPAAPALDQALPAWEYLLDRLRKATNLPTTIIYCPVVPVIKDGAIRFHDPDAAQAAQFLILAEERGFATINMTRIFKERFAEHGDFPRGFFNSRPSRGHLNAVGHKLIARTIHEHLAAIQKQSHAVHSN